MYVLKVLDKCSFENSSPAPGVGGAEAKVQAPLLCFPSGLSPKLCQWDLPGAQVHSLLSFLAALITAALAYDPPTPSLGPSLN